ncbi:hypothetical protein, conserved [Trypanosoma brucei brucei TREU927]|uniref:Uncharacterized protein n=1 Tax=Trypanosoma brucei brucei (strain 927/4 GUTat10.1) TaxID=185431 RepID=Q580B9_TRYB2|nr:hypothetical protein, conserved [Trypanosoma brucei brucei TREU927]AAX80926.1 hypothetical protein, conserved [Trypanosoma brucei]AAZ10682.1 hypothetical protein, conserved [Trypanosoma brucei brucei TREU927]
MLAPFLVSPASCLSSPFLCFLRSLLFTVAGSNLLVKWLTLSRARQENMSEVDQQHGGHSALECSGHLSLTKRPPSAQVGGDPLILGVKSRVKELRRLVEEKSRLHKTLENRLRVQTTETARMMSELQALDHKIEEAQCRKRRLLRLDVAARKRQEQLRVALKEADTALMQLKSRCTQPCGVGMGASPEKLSSQALPIVPPSVGPSDEAVRVATACSTCGEKEQAGLQQKLYSVRTKYRKLCEENRKLQMALDDISAEETATSSSSTRKSSGCSNSVNKDRLEYRVALEELIGSFMEATSVSASPH